MAHEAVIVRDQGTIFLAGPPLVRAATAEVVTDEDHGGGLLHSRTSGVTEHPADDDVHALAVVRNIVASLGPPSERPWRREHPEEPLLDPEELLSVVPADARIP